MMAEQSLGPAEFVRDLEALSQRYGIAIKGEPQLVNMEPEDRRERYAVVLGSRLVRKQ